MRLLSLSSTDFWEACLVLRPGPFATPAPPCLETRRPTDLPPATVASMLRGPSGRRRRAGEPHGRAGRRGCRCCGRRGNRRGNGHRRCGRGRYGGDLVQVGDATAPAPGWASGASGVGRTVGGGVVEDAERTTPTRATPAPTPTASNVRRENSACFGATMADARSCKTGIPGARPGAEFPGLERAPLDAPAPEAGSAARPGFQTTWDGGGTGNRSRISFML